MAESDKVGDTDDDAEVYETQRVSRLPPLCPLEIFERGRAFQEANDAIRMQEAGEIDESKVKTS
jgi:hypothetical protein